MKSSTCLAALILLPFVATAHGGGEHLKGLVKAVRAEGLTLDVDGKEVAIAFDKATTFEKSGARAKASELSAGARAVVHLKAGKGPATAAVVKFAPGPAAQRVVVTVTNDGYLAAAHPPLKAGQPVTLVVTRTVEKTCANDLVIKDYQVNQPLPLNTPVEVTFTPTRAGKVRMACAMDMVAGELVVQ